MGARTTAARAEVVASRQILLDEVIRLEAAGRSAIDIPAKIRRAPAKTAALAAGAAFVVLKGPQRLYRRVRRVVLGSRADLPKSMLPQQIDKALRSLGDDGQKVRGVIEREFAGFLEKHGPERESRDLKGTLSALGGNILRPATAAAGKRLASGLFSPEGGSFDAAMERIRARRETRKAALEAAAAAEDADGSPPSVSAPAPTRLRWLRRH